MDPNEIFLTAKEFIIKNLTVAIWGALIGTLVFLFSIFKWIDSKKNKVTISEDHDKAYAQEGPFSFSYVITNSGPQPVSITNATCSFYKNIFSFLFNKPHTERPAYRGSLPHKLEPGDVWYWNINLQLGDTVSQKVTRVKLGKVVEEALVADCNSIKVPTNKRSSSFVLRLYLSDRKTPFRINKRMISSIRNCKE